MKRTLAQLRARLRRPAGRRRSPPSATWSSDSRTLAAGRAVRGAARADASTATSSWRAAAAAGAAGARGRCARSRWRCRRSWCRTQAALARAARAWRARFGGPLIGVAGSNGKTTAKEMTAAILSQAGECLATRGNLNNHIGVPLTLLRLDAARIASRSSRWAPIAPGDVARLVALARPTVGLITNAGAEHLEGFGCSRAWRAPKARWSRACAPTAHRRDQCRRCVRAACGARSTLARVVELRHARAADFTRERGAHRRSAQRASAPASACAPRSGSARGRACTSAARTTSPTRWPPRPRRPAPARRSSTSRGPRRGARRAGPAAVQAGAPAAPGSSTIPTTPIRARCAPAIEVLAHARRAGAGWCSATWPSSASSPRTSTAEIGEFARAHGHRAAVRHRRARGAARSRASAPARELVPDDARR